MFSYNAWWGSRTPDTRSETIPSSRITPDLQIHSFSSSVHSLIFFRVQVREHLTRDQRPFLHPESLQIFRFTASSLQFTSLIFYRVQVREHLTRDQRPFLHPESLQIFRFTASSLQFTHSSSSGFRSENTWHEIRDHSFIQNHSRSSDSQLLLFSSLIFYRVQIREHLTRDQRPFLHPESLQIFRYTASPLQFTSLIFYRVQIREHLTRDQRPFLHPESLQIFRFTASSLQFTSLIFYRVQIREHLTRDQRPFLHPEPLQIFRFTASSLQFTHSSSTGFRSENTWHEIRDHSFIQNHSRSSDSQLLLFSSPHSSSTGFRSENTWHEIRDHSFIQNHSRSSDSQLLLFSSLTHLLQGSDQRTPDTRSETIPSSRITPDLQIHSFFSSVHSLIFYRVQVREHLTRDQRPFLHPESLQILQIHSFSSSVQPTHFLQGSGQRTPDTRSETIPSSRITPDLQIHSFSSSVHLTHLLQGSGQRTPDTRSETIPSSRITPDLQIHSFFSSVHSLIFYRVQVREHLTRDQTPFLHPESLQIFRFTASPLQFTHSSSTGFRSENTWHEIRDHSFIQNHSRSSDSQLLLFSSPHSSSTGFRSENTGHEIRDHSFIQNHSRSSDTQLLLFSSLIFYRVQVREHLTRDQRPFLHPESLQIFRFTASSLQFISLIFYRVQIREHLTRDQRPFLHPESLQIFRFTASSLQFISLIFYRVQVREHLTRDQTPFLHPESLQIFRFTASPLQFTSLIFYRVQVREHLTRAQRPFLHPESLQIFRFTASSLQFPHLLQGSGQRTPDTRSETIPSSRITPDLQIHSFFSSVHSLIFYRVQVREHLTRDQRPFLHPESLQIFRFTASPLQFTPLIFYRVQVREHLTRDQTPFLHPESLQIFRFTASSLQFTSLIFYRVQIREHRTRDQRPFLHPESLQIFRFTASSLQFTSSSTGFRSEDWNGHSRSLVLCSVTRFCVVFEVCFGLLYGLKIQTWPIIRLITESVTYWFCICWYLMESMMCLNKMSRTSSRNIGPQHQKYSSRFNCTHGVLFIPVFTKPILSVCC